jgi:hypothetical protein
MEEGMSGSKYYGDVLADLAAILGDVDGEYTLFYFAKELERVEVHQDELYLIFRDGGRFTLAIRDG